MEYFFNIMRYHGKRTKIVETQDPMAMELNKPEDDSYLFLALIKLEEKSIDLVVINGYPFVRSAFTFKSSGRFNWSKAIDLFAWAYHKDIMIELVNMKIDTIK